MEKPVRIAVAGAGVIGTFHISTINSLDELELAAICEIDQTRAQQCREQYGVDVYSDYVEMLEEADIEAVLIATPHYSHSPQAIEALKRGVHVLVEKPVGVYGKAVRRMMEAYREAKQRKKELVCAAMFNQRTYGHWRKIRDLVHNGELGKLLRTTWILTDWFRTHTYYRQGTWRATWEGEGGGVLLNQCPHNLDLYQWILGMPTRVHGHAYFGKYHDIEVEDDVTAFFEHDNGMIGHFITTTGEAPGTNRLEIAGEHGKIVFEGNELFFYRNRVSALDFSRTTELAFGMPECWKIPIPFDDHGESGHKMVVENFAAAIRRGEELIAPAEEGLESVLLGNAILQSAFDHAPVELPMDEEAFEGTLEGLISNEAAKSKDS
jgi:predicted dehydrogenase